ncbi:MAG: thymidine kinase [Mycoplasmataceae bacterium]|nr:thymidine kinase [Mycoplasmataceae bacterium]
MKRAKLELYYGPMFSGKSALLIKDILSNIDIPKLVFKPIADIRSKKIYTREGLEFESIGINKSSEIMKYIEEWVEKVYIDEINFFDETLVDVIIELMNIGIDVVCSGLDTDYRAEYFPITKKLIKIADKGIKLKAKCSICGEGSSWTARFINGKPDSKKSPTIISDKLNANIEYLTVCEKHHPFLCEKK